MEAEFVLFCYVVTARSIAQKSVCNHILTLHFMAICAGRSGWSVITCCELGVSCSALAIVPAPFP